MEIELKSRKSPAKYKKIIASLDTIFVLEDICSDLNNLISEYTEKHNYYKLLKRAAETNNDLNAMKLYSNLCEKSLIIKNKYQVLYDDAYNKYINADNELKKII
jgi:hypothetical protein